MLLDAGKHAFRVPGVVARRGIYGNMKKKGFAAQSV